MSIALDLVHLHLTKPSVFFKKVQKVVALGTKYFHSDKEKEEDEEREEEEEYSVVTSEELGVARVPAQTSRFDKAHQSGRSLSQHDCAPSKRTRERVDVRPWEQFRLPLDANGATRSRLDTERRCRSRTLEAVFQSESHDTKTLCIFASVLVDGFGLFV